MRGFFFAWDTEMCGGCRRERAFTTMPDTRGRNMLLSFDGQGEGSVASRDVKCNAANIHEARGVLGCACFH